MARKKYSEFEKQMMKDTGNNLKNILREKGIQQKELSEFTGLAQSTISDYINAKTLISPGNLQIIADALKVNKSSIDSSFKMSEDSTVKLPVYSSIACGQPCMVAEKAASYEVTPKSWLNGGEYFYLIAKGDSMIGARIHEGDLLLIRKQPTVEEGEIAAVVIEDECTLKRVYHHNGTLVLQSENPKYAPIIIKKGDVRIIGKLKTVIIKYY